jgi:uncharacterized repeat protein (TIGR03803 family)
MKTGKRLVPGLVIALSMFICLTSALAEPYSILHNFAGGADDGLSPVRSSLTLSGSTLYGMTSDGPKSDDPPPYHYAGTLFKINTDGNGYQILHDFGDTNTDGTGPRGSLTLSGSTLYGFTAYGGGPNAFAVGGSVFKINTDGYGYEILHRFSGDTFNQLHPYGAPVISGSKLYGMTCSEETGHKGAIFVMNTDGNEYQLLHEFGSIVNDGAHPYGSLTLVGSTLYGMTSTGGSGGIEGGGGGYGVIFSINTDGSDYQVLYNFLGPPSDGNNPNGALTLVGSKLYGMTANGGPGGGGVLFSINQNGTGYEVLFNFGSVGIAGPLGSLTLWGSKLYGMVSQGGSGGNGAVFRINPDGTGFQLLHAFNSSLDDGGGPQGDVTFLGSTLYGVTYAGGSSSGGVIFSLQTPQSLTGMLQLLLLD